LIRTFEPLNKATHKEMISQRRRRERPKIHERRPAIAQVYENSALRHRDGFVRLFEHVPLRFSLRSERSFRSDFPASRDRSLERFRFAFRYVASKTLRKRGRAQEVRSSNDDTMLA